MDKKVSRLGVSKSNEPSLDRRFFHFVNSAVSNAFRSLDDFFMFFFLVQKGGKTGKTEKWWMILIGGKRKGLFIQAARRTRKSYSHEKNFVVLVLQLEREMRRSVLRVRKNEVKNCNSFAGTIKYCTPSLGLTCCLKKKSWNLTLYPFVPKVKGLLFSCTMRSRPIQETKNSYQSLLISHRSFLFQKKKCVGISKATRNERWFRENDLEWKRSAWKEFRNAPFHFFFFSIPKKKKERHISNISLLRSGLSLTSLLVMSSIRLLYHHCRNLTQEW